MCSVICAWRTSSMVKRSSNSRMKGPMAVDVVLFCNYAVRGEYTLVHNHSADLVGIYYVQKGEQGRTPLLVLAAASTLLVVLLYLVFVGTIRGQRLDNAAMKGRRSPSRIACRTKGSFSRRSSM